jgi:hypothetical protein
MGKLDVGVSVLAHVLRDRPPGYTVTASSITINSPDHPLATPETWGQKLWVTPLYIHPSHNFSILQ